MSFLKNKKKKNYFELLTLFFLIVFIIFGVKYYVHKVHKKELTNMLKITKTVRLGKIKYKVFTAKTLPEKRRGLMFVKTLPANYGMLFIFHKNVDYPFWMKNTLIPLTALFISSTGKVINQVSMSPCIAPAVCKFYAPFVYYRYALEINKTNKKFIGKKVKIGDLL